MYNKFKIRRQHNVLAGIHHLEEGGPDAQLRSGAGRDQVNDIYVCYRFKV